MHRRTLLAATLCGALRLGLAPALPAAAASAGELVDCMTVDIDRLGAARLDALRSGTPSSEGPPTFWIEADRELLLCGAPASAIRDAAAAAGARVAQDHGRIDPDRLRLVAAARAEDLAAAHLRVLARGGRWAVVEVPPDVDRARPWHGAHAGAETSAGPTTLGAALLPLQRNTVLARQQANQSFEARLAPTPPGSRLVEEVDGARWHADIVTLAGWNRWTRGSQIALARDWLVAQLDALPGLAVHTESFPVTSSTGWNVFATLTGTTRPDDWYLVGAHYDATSQSASTAAPGAEDNASGCAGVLEMARIFSAHPPEATIHFICYSGEEQGLYGSADHAADLVASGNDDHIRGILIMDMIGYTGDSDLDCLLESSSLGQPLIDAFAAAAAAYTNLRIVTSLFPFGSDHVPYLQRGMPALLVIENDWDSYPHYHRTTDLPNQISLPMGTETLKMNVAALAAMVGVADPCLFCDGFESGNVGAWDEAAP